MQIITILFLTILCNFPCLNEQQKKQYAQNFFVYFEVLDERECRYILTENSFVSDLCMIQRRIDEYVYTPLAKSSDAFNISRELINEKLVFNRACRKFHEDNAAVYDNKLYLKDLDLRYEVWDALRDAKCEYYYVIVRRQALEKLRKLIGDEDFMLGVMPPHVNLAYFQNIN